MIFVGGLSGSGKTTLTERLAAERPDIRVIRASAVLEDLNRRLTELTHALADENQRVLASWLECQLINTPVVLDGHGLILTAEDPFVYKVPAEFFLRSGATLVVWINTPARELLFRRTWPRPFRSSTALSALQKMEGAYLEQNAIEVGASFCEIAGNDYHRFAKCILQHLSV